MKNLQLVLIVALSISTGALGVLWLQGSPASAQSQRGFSECFNIVSRDWAHARDRGHLERAEGRFPVPRGWTPVGGGANDAGFNVVLCR